VSDEDFDLSSVVEKATTAFGGRGPKAASLLSPLDIALSRA
jgi:hypothetical protein